MAQKSGPSDYDNQDLANESMTRGKTNIPHVRRRPGPYFAESCDLTVDHHAGVSRPTEHSEFGEESMQDMYIPENHTDFADPEDDGQNSVLQFVLESKNGASRQPLAKIDNSPTKPAEFPLRLSQIDPRVFLKNKGVPLKNSKQLGMAFVKERQGSVKTVEEKPGFDRGLVEEEGLMKQVNVSSIHPRVFVKRAQLEDSKHVDPAKEEQSTSKNLKEDTEFGLDFDEEGAFKWTKSKILLLLHLYGEMKESFDNPQTLKNKLWKTLSKKMNGEGYDVSPEQCKRKFDSLKKKYKDVKDNNAGTGNGRKTFEFFEDIDRLLGKDLWVTPKSTASSMQHSDSDSSDFEEQPRPRKKRLTTNVLMQELLEEKRKSREQREQKLKIFSDLLGKLVTNTGEYIK